MVRGSVLIVDEEPIVRESIAHWLKNAGYQVVTAESSELAREMVESQDFSVMIVDLRLPGRAGLRVLKEVKALKPQTKSVAIAAYPSTALAAEAMKLGTVDYLIKPVAPDDLEALILEALLKCQSYE